MMKIFIAVALGIITWPILEYGLHRFLGHEWKINTLFKKEHTAHHVYVHRFGTPLYKVLAAIPVTLAFFGLVTLITGSWQMGLGFTSGFGVMYSFYEYVHYSFHTKAPKTKLGLKLRKHHLAHHFNNSQMNHGVTTTVIDRLFGTYLEVPVVKVPKNFPFVWLMNQDNSAVIEKYSKDFQLKQSKAPDSEHRDQPAHV